MSTKGTKRKTAAEFANEHEDFLLMIAEKRPELEIAVRLKLSAVQLRAHILEVLKKQEVNPDDLKPRYEAVYAKALPMEIRKLMSLELKDDAEALVKVEPQGDGVVLTLLCAALPRQGQLELNDTEELPVAGDTDEEMA